jgi:TonB family protein
VRKTIGDNMNRSLRHTLTYQAFSSAGTYVTLAILSAIIAGCGIAPETEKSDGPSELIYQTPLPAMPKTMTDLEMQFSVLFHIANDGTVLETRLLSPTGDNAWDAKAMEEMKQWRFSASHAADTTYPLWIRIPLRVHWMEPTIFRLAEIACHERAVADSAFALSDASSRSKDGIIGNIDIRVYPSRIRALLKNLRENEFTKPLHFGDSFVIFKRLSGEGDGRTK